MKKTNKFLLAALALGGALFAQSCQEKPLTPEKVEPVFPDLIEKTIEKGQETTVFKFQPNLDWKVEVTGEGAGTSFWIDDAGMKETSIKGLANKEVEFSVVFSDETLFDVILECQVKMTMGNATQLIGKLIKSPIERTLAFKVAKKDEFTFTNEYVAAPVENEKPQAELCFFPGNPEYSRPVEILANYAWNLVLPDWCAAYVEGEKVEGTVTGEANKPFALTLMADLDLAPEAGKKEVSSLIKVVDAVVSEEFSELTVILPEFASRIELEIASNTEFNHEGYCKTPTGAFSPDALSIAYVLSTEDVVFKALPWEGEWYGTNFADWVLFEKGWNPEGGLLQNYPLTMKVSPYDQSGERIADILVLPKSMDNTDINTYVTVDGGSIKPEYQKYLLNRLTQTGLVADYLTPVYPDEMAGAKIAYNADEKGYSWVYSYVPFKKMVSITYAETWSGENSEGSLKLSSPYDHIRVFDSDLTELDVTKFDNEEYWVSMTGPFGLDRDQIKFLMNPDACTTESKEFFVAFYLTADASDAETIVVCKYDSEAQVDPSADVMTVTSNNATLTKLEEGSEWYTKFDSDFGTSGMAGIPQPVYYELVTNSREVSLQTAFSFQNVLLFSAEVGFPDYPDDSITLDAMSETLEYVYVDASVTAKKEAVILFKDENLMNVAVVHFVFDPNAADPVVKAPFEFAYPDAVQEATLAPYSGNMDVITDNFYGAKQENVYQLTYESELGNTAMLKTPGQPAFLFGFNAPEGEEDTYWLNSKWDPMSSELSVRMSEIGKTDYLVWKAADGYTFQYILVCTRTK